MRFALILSLLIAVVAVVFAIYNPEETTVNLFYYQITSPLALVIIVSLLAGVLAGVLVSMPSRIAAGARARKLEKRVAELESSEPTVVERPVATDRPATHADRPAGRADAADAAETQRLAAETQRMAADAQKRAADIEKGRRDTD